jgi:hypothetical protein
MLGADDERVNGGHVTTGERMLREVVEATRAHYDRQLCEKTYTPKGESSMLGMRGINIEECANGWIVKVGCQTFVYDDLDYLMIDLGLYLTDPVETEKAILADAQNYQRHMQDAQKIGNLKAQEEQRYRAAFNNCTSGPEAPPSVDQCDGTTPSTNSY